MNEERKKRGLAYSKFLTAVAISALLLGSDNVMATQTVSGNVPDIKEQLQTIAVTGVVLDAADEPIIGASVVEKGTTNGGITDINGRFTLNVKPGAILKISYVGYQPQEVKATRTMKIVLAEDSEILSEVVVVGYGSQKRENLTGAIATVDISKTYEGLVRKILSSKSHPALMLVHNVCYNNGASAELVHSRIARHYNIPSVSMQSTLYKALLNCRFDNRRITPDDLHPNDCGHELVSMVITKRLEQIKNTVKAEYETAKSQRAAAQPDAGAAALLPEPLTANAYEDSVRYRNYNSTPELDGFKADMSEQRDITDCFKKGYTASENGACITFKVKGSCIAVQFRKTIHKPAPVAVAVIDGDEANAVTLDANFDETWGDKLELYTLLEHGENKEHTVQIKLVKTSEADASEFYLVSIIASGH